MYFQQNHLDNWNKLFVPELTVKKKLRTELVEKSKKPRLTAERGTETLNTRCEEPEIPLDKETEVVLFSNE